MAMFPIFIIGLVVGIIVSYAFYKYKQSTPSETKLHTQENIIKQLEKDNSILNDLVDKLYSKIDKLESELKNK